MIKNTRKPIKPKKTSKIRAALNQAKKEGWIDRIRTPSDEIAASNGAFFCFKKRDLLDLYWDNFAYLVEGQFAGEKFERLPWQRELTEEFLCWLEPSQEHRRNIRRFKFSYTEAPKKQGKNPTISALAVYLLKFDGAPQANIGVAASNRRQAERVILASWRAMRESGLDQVCKTRIFESFTQIQSGDSKMETLPSTPEGADGYVGSIIYDEIHRAKGRKLFQAIRYAIVSSWRHCFIGLTTAGDSRESVAWDMRQKTLNIQEGREFDTKWSGRIYAIPDTADESDPEEWKKANPSLGEGPEYPLKLSEFKADYQEAIKSGASDFRNFLRLRMGRWQHAINNWLDPVIWDAGEQSRQDGFKDCYEDFDPKEFMGRSFCVGGADFGATKDSTSLAIVGEHPEDKEKLFVVSYFWIPEARAEELEGRIPFTDWAEDPRCNLKITPGNVQDFQALFDDLADIFKAWDCWKFYYDPGFQSEYLCQVLENERGVERVKFEQTRKNFSPCMKSAERRIESRKLVHNGNRMLNHQLQNMAVDESNGEIKPVKPPYNNNNTKQIDGWIAILEALIDFVRHEHDLARYEGSKVV